MRSLAGRRSLGLALAGVLVSILPITPADAEVPVAEFDVSSTTGVPTTSPPLDPANLYEAEVSGAYSYDLFGTGQNAADAECANFANGTPMSRTLWDGFGQDHLDLIIDGVGREWTADDPAGADCSDPLLTAAPHRYRVRFTPRERGPVPFVIRDGNYADNRGSLRVRIFAIALDINPDVSTNMTDANAATGGRVNGLASVTGSANTFYAASEWGGLFKSTDGGARWRRLDKHLPVALWDVETNTNTVYATSLYDGRVASVSGIEVSTDAGTTWTHPATATPAAARCQSADRATQPSAFGIAVHPDPPNAVFVGTNCGVARSIDGGATWTFLDLTPTNGVGGVDVWDVAVQRGGTGNSGIVDACGDEGVFRSTDGGATWTGYTALPAANRAGAPCSIAVSPDEPNVVFVSFQPPPVAGALPAPLVVENDNAPAGAWINLQNPSPLGRIPFVETNDRTNGGAQGDFNLWVGDRNLHRANCVTGGSPAGASRCPVGTWATTNTGAHDDAGAVVFNTAAANDRCPALYSSDGGVHTPIVPPPPLDCHTPSWTRSNAGLHATWLWSMAGANHSPNTDAAEDVYWGTQDTGAFATTNAGAALPTVVNPECCDVFDFAADSTRAVYTQCCFLSQPRMFYQGPGLTGTKNQVGTLPPGSLRFFGFPDSIDQFGSDKYVVATSTGTFQNTLSITSANPTWTQIAPGAPAPAGCAVQASQVGPAVGPPESVFFLMVGTCDPHRPNQLWKAKLGDPRWTRIDSGLAGGIGIFAVDPNDGNRLYASHLDPVGGPRMVRSNDGGTTWVADANLDRMMTGGGMFRYQAARGADSSVPINTELHVASTVQPSLVAFDPEDRNIIVAGGEDSGVFVSTDNGASWRLLTDPFNSGTSGVPHLPRPRYAHFDHEPAGSATVFIGTQGRGVWRLRLGARNADLSITKTDAPDPVVAGNTITYTVTVRNGGPGAGTSVVVNDPVPPGTTFQALAAQPGWTCEQPAAGGTGRVRCAKASVANGEAAVFTITVRVNPDVAEGTVITNTATVTSPENSNSTNDAATARTTVTRGAPGRGTPVTAVLVDSRNPAGAGTPVPLSAGQAYVLEARGTFNYRAQGDDADAECSVEVADTTYRPTRYGPHPANAQNWLDTLVNDVAVTWNPHVSDLHLTGELDCNSTDHVYVVDFTPAANGPVTFRINDTFYGDNEGVILVVVYQRT